jgi:ABC-type Na+ transport system ATPase subunit NatA
MPTCKALDDVSLSTAAARSSDYRPDGSGKTLALSHLATLLLARQGSVTAKAFDTA